MNNKTINVLLLIILIIGIGYIYLSEDYNKQLETQIKERDKTIQEIKTTDSLLIEKTKDYVKQIEEFNSRPSVLFEGRKITATEIVDLLNISEKENLNLEIENYKLRLNDSIHRINKSTLEYNISVYEKAYKQCKKAYEELVSEAKNYNDTLAIMRIKLSSIKNTYGIDLKVKQIDSATIAIDKPMLKIDSALIIFPYYKNRLSFKDSIWNIDIDSAYEKSQKKQLEKENKRRNQK